MMESMVMTLIGKDRPGLVESFAAVIENHGGNWEESRMVQLAGEFAGVLHVHVPGDRAGDLEAALGELEGMSVAVAVAVEVEPTAPAARFLELDVVGQDHPGIVRRVAAAIAAAGINVEELETAVESAAMSGEKMFHAKARLLAPKSVSRDDLKDALEELSHDLMVELRVEEPEG